MASETERTFLTFFFQNPKKQDFLTFFLSCCTHFLEHCSTWSQLLVKVVRVNRVLYHQTCLFVFHSSGNSYS